MTVTGRSSGARIATNTISAPGVRVPVTIASHSWSCTRISVARNIPEPDHLSPDAIGSLRVDRAPDDREECLLEGHRPHGGRQPVAERNVHDLVNPLRLRDHVQRCALRDGLAKRDEQFAMVPSVLDAPPHGPANLPLPRFRRSFEQDPPLP